MTHGIDRAFNEGCDARWAGLPPGTNPYIRVESYMATSWTRGWNDIHLHWGVNAKWRVKPLQLVRHNL